MNDQLAAQLERLKQRDLETRARLQANDRLYGNYHQAMQTVHVENARALDNITQQHGWPGISLVGLAGGQAAWLIARHSISTPELQRNFLGLLTVAAQQGEAPMKQVAMLTDRICFNENRPQVYGTVFDWDENGVLGCNVQDPETVDERRKIVGLPPYQEALRENIAAIENEGGKPSQDFTGHQQAFLPGLRASAGNSGLALRPTRFK